MSSSSLPPDERREVLTGLIGSATGRCVLRVRSAEYLVIGSCWVPFPGGGWSLVPPVVPSQRVRRGVPTADRGRKGYVSDDKRYTRKSDVVVRPSAEDCRSALELRAEWAAWIATFGWNRWGTLTFRDAGPGRNVGRRVSAYRASASMCRRAFRITGRSACAAVAGEYGSKSGRYHLHCLLRMDDRGCERALQWWEFTYGLTHDRSYDCRGGADEYITKYILKEESAIGEFALDIYPGRAKWRASGIRTTAPTIFEEQERQKAHWRIESLETEITTGQETPLSAEEKQEIRKTLRAEKARLNRRYEGECVWLDERRMTGYDRYLAELERK